MYILIPVGSILHRDMISDQLKNINCGYIWCDVIPFGATESWESSKLVKLGWSDLVWLSVSNHFEHSDNGSSWVKTSLKMCVHIPLNVFYLSIFFVLRRETVQRRALHWTSEMATLWPTPTWAPLRMASNTFTERWGSTGWPPLARTTLDQKLQCCTCMWQVSPCPFTCMYVNIQACWRKDNLFSWKHETFLFQLISQDRTEYPPNAHTHTHTHSNFVCRFLLIYFCSVMCLCVCVPGQASSSPSISQLL